MLKNIHRRPGVRYFVANQFFSPFTLTNGGGEVSIPPKSDDVIYEQPLTHAIYIKQFHKAKQGSEQGARRNVT